MQNIPQVGANVTQITSAEFVKITIFNDYSDPANVSIYTVSSSYKPENIDGQIYSPLGGFISVGGQNRDLRVTSGATNITLSGVSGNNIAVVLGTKIAGSEVEVIRGFYDSNMVISNAYVRFTGIITSYSISEDRQDQIDNFTVSVSASSYKTVLENRIAGRKTNKESWQSVDPTDVSMNQVYAISGVPFDFGQSPKGKTVVSSGATNYNNNNGSY